ncbi:hypothetical protein Hdeb2414_s0007g00261031 [Helianthus debilis subsp. tardiflorus]
MVNSGSKRKSKSVNAVRQKDTKIRQGTPTPPSSPVSHTLHSPDLERGKIATAMAAARRLDQPTLIRSPSHPRRRRSWISSAFFQQEQRCAPTILISFIFLLDPVRSLSLVSLIVCFRVVGS